MDVLRLTRSPVRTERYRLCDGRGLLGGGRVHEQPGEPDRFDQPDHRWRDHVEPDRLPVHSPTIRIRLNLLLDCDIVSCGRYRRVGRPREGSSGTPYFLSTTDAGASWGVHLAPETMPFVPNIKCFSSGDCWLSGQSGTGVTTDGGSSWSVSFYGSKLTLSSISCVTANECFVAGSFPDLVKNNLGAFITPSANPMGVLIELEQGGAYSGIDTSDQHLCRLD